MGSSCSGSASGFTHLPEENCAISQASIREETIKAVGLWAKRVFCPKLLPAKIQKDLFFLLSYTALTLSTFW